MNLIMPRVRFHKSLSDDSRAGVTQRNRKALQNGYSWLLVIGLLCLPLSAGAGCSDEDFLKAEEIYQRAMQTTSVDAKIGLFKEAFSTCPSHGAYAHGYFELGKLFFDRNDKEEAFKWLLEANRFKAVMLQRSVAELAQTNKCLGELYREKGDAERALIHLNIYRALTKFQDKSMDQHFLQNADSYFSVIYSQETVKETLSIDKAIAREHRPELNRIEVYFDFAKSTLTDDSKKRLDGIGQALQSKNFNQSSIVVEGHTDQAGDEAYNCGLGTDRARAAAEYLKSQWGLDTVQFVPVSYGKSAPAIARTSENRKSWPAADKFNRRVVVWNAGAMPSSTKDITVEYGVPSPCGDAKR